MKEITGQIDAVKKNQKGVRIGENWYYSFKVLNEFEVGDLVKIAYKEQGDFKNIDSIIKLDQETKELKKKEIPRETINTLVMAMMNIYLQENKPIELCAELVVKGYNKLISSL